MVIVSGGRGCPHGGQPGSGVVITRQLGPPPAFRQGADLRFARALPQCGAFRTTLRNAGPMLQDLDPDDRSREAARPSSGRAVRCSTFRGSAGEPVASLDAVRGLVEHAGEMTRLVSG
jgi:hypothetical protein